MREQMKICTCNEVLKTPSKSTSAAGTLSVAFSVDHPRFRAKASMPLKVSTCLWNTWMDVLESEDFFFFSTGVWTQGFMLARLVLYHLRHSTSLRITGKQSTLPDLLSIINYSGLWHTFIVTRVCMAWFLLTKLMLLLIRKKSNTRINQPSKLQDS
jgi:hypothetical protein